MYFKKIRLILLFLILPNLIFATGKKEKPLTTYNFYAMGTNCSIGLYKENQKIFLQVEEIVIDLEAKLSTNLPDSEITKINNNAGISPVEVSPDTFFLISKGIEFSKLSNGAFDISIGPLVKLWNINEGGPKVPATVEIKKALGLINYKNILINSEDSINTVFLTKKNMAIEPGGIAKGFIADYVTKHLKDNGIESAIINFGGNVVAIGEKPDNIKWRIAIQNPEASRGSYLGIISVKDKSVVTSGKYERFFIGEDGLRYHHILNTKTGFPVENNISQVSIITKSSTTADALSTSVFSLGIKDGLSLIESFDDVDAVIVTEDKKILLTGDLKNNFKLTADDFSILK